LLLAINIINPCELYYFHVPARVLIRTEPTGRENEQKLAQGPVPNLEKLKLFEDFYKYKRESD
jgi:hypothetical protein